MNTLVKITAATLLTAQLGFVALVLDANGSVNTSARVLTADNKNHALAEPSEDIVGDTYSLLDKKLVTPYGSKVKRQQTKRKMFSRCPSGYIASVEEVAETESGYSYGEFNLWEGCDPKEICRFRARLSDNSVDILQSDSVNYMAVDLWINNATSSLH